MHFYYSFSRGFFRQRKCITIRFNKRPNVSAAGNWILCETLTTFYFINSSTGRPQVRTIHWTSLLKVPLHSSNVFWRDFESSPGNFPCNLTHEPSSMFQCFIDFFSLSWFSEHQSLTKSSSCSSLSADIAAHEKTMREDRFPKDVTANVNKCKVLGTFRAKHVIFDSLGCRATLSWKNADEWHWTGEEARWLCNY